MAGRLEHVPAPGGLHSEAPWRWLQGAEVWVIQVPNILMIHIHITYLYIYIYIYLESRMNKIFCSLWLLPVLHVFFVQMRIWPYLDLSSFIMSYYHPNYTIMIYYDRYSYSSPAASGADRFPDRWIKRAVRTGFYNIFMWRMGQT